MQFEEAISLDFDYRHSQDESHHSLEAFKESLVKDFLVQINLVMQPRFAIELGQAVQAINGQDLPSPRHQTSTKAD